MVNCGVGCRRGQDPRLLWHRLAATASIRPPAWEHPCATAAALKTKKTNKIKKIKKKKKKVPKLIGTGGSFQGE